jgi:hypothetical protein
MTVYVHVQDTGTTDSIEGAYVRYIFNPGAAYADTADGFTNTSGDLTLQHDLVTGADEIPALLARQPISTSMEQRRPLRPSCLPCMT